MKYPISFQLGRIEFSIDGKNYSVEIKNGLLSKKTYPKELHVLGDKNVASIPYHERSTLNGSLSPGPELSLLLEKAPVDASFTFGSDQGEGKIKLKIFGFAVGGFLVAELD